MHRRSSRRAASRAWRLALLPLAATLAASCTGPEATAPRPSGPRLDLAASPDVAEREVIINDEVWVDRTIDETPVEMASGMGEAAAVGTTAVGAADVGAQALAPEPLIRVGVVYSELNATTIRLGGRDNADPFELRTTTAPVTVLASGVLGEAVVTRLSTGPGGQYRITLPNGTTITRGDPVALVSASGKVRVRRTTGDASVYRGTAEVRFNSARTYLVGINELPIEQYLYGVVPRELGPLAYPLLEAQKTQAVSARTFARRRMQFCGASRCGHGYHIIPTTTDQVYGGSTGEYALSNQAVDETRGVVGTYNGGLIEGLYSSTTGGWTANSEDVYLNALPYLRSVPDHERGAALDHVPSLEVFRRHANPTNLRNHANGDFEADWSIYHRWYVDWTVEEMRQVAGRVGSATFVDPGQVYAINVTARSQSGHARTIEFVTEKRGTLVANKDGIRSALRYVTYNAAGAMVLNSLRSTMVYVVPQVDPQTKQVVGWEAWGGGWGHGVGMSQTGAVGMAEKGRAYTEILGHYYRGVVLEKRWE